jgi:pyroglutamyl-peptidase
MDAETPMPTVLLTGFEPFEGEALNPSWEAVSRLAGTEIRDHRIEVARLPVVFGQALEVLREALQRTKPALVLCVGQAKGIVGIQLERVALNLDDARIPDNAGQQPVDRPVVPGGPAACFATLPLREILSRLHAAHIPAHLSLSAGTYVCNHVFYGLCHWAAANHPDLPHGFLHIPLLPEQAVRHPGQPSLGLDQVVQALRIAVETTLEGTGP